MTDKLTPSEARDLRQHLDKHFNPGPDTDPPLDLATVPRDSLADHEFSAIQPPAPVLRYLATDDPLTHHTINKMELALEDHYRLPDPWYITADRTGTEGKDLTITAFRLLRDLDKEKGS